MQELYFDWMELGWRVAAELFNENRTGDPSPWIRCRHQRVFEKIDAQ